jgi:hypothetical protein
MEAYNVYNILARQEAKPTSPANMVDWEKRETKENVLLRMFVKDNIIPHIRDLIHLRKLGTHSKVCMKRLTN